MVKIKKVLVKGMVSLKKENIIVKEKVTMKKLLYSKVSLINKCREVGRVVHKVNSLKHKKILIKDTNG